MESLFVIDASEAERLQKESGLGLEDFLSTLIEQTCALARPPISKFRVGAIGMGPSGRLFKGVNLEFPGLPLHHAVHAEQFLVINMLQHGEKSLRCLAVSAAPCGHCRQFLQELRNAPNIEVVIVDYKAETQMLAKFLPHRFGPHDLLGEEFPLLLEYQNNDLSLESDSFSLSFFPPPFSGSISSFVTANFGGNGHSHNHIPSTALQKDTVLNISLKMPAIQEPLPSYMAIGKEMSNLSVNEKIPDGLEMNVCLSVEGQRLRDVALEAANRSYAPYSNCPSGMAILTATGSIYSGYYIESAAYNPSISPLQAALIAFVAAGGKGYEDIIKAVLVEKQGAVVQQASTVRLVLDKISPRCSLYVYEAGALKKT